MTDRFFYIVLAVLALPGLIVIGFGLLRGVNPFAAMAAAFSPRGRTTRSGYWSFIAVFLTIDVIVTLGLRYRLTRDVDRALDHVPSTQAENVLEAAILWAVIALLVVLIAALVLTTIRRLHDRGRTALWAILYVAVPLMVMTLLRANAADGGQILGAAATPLAVANLLLALWAVIDVGFLPGTMAGNRFGPLVGNRGAEAARREERHDVL